MRRPSALALAVVVLSLAGLGRSGAQERPAAAPAPGDCVRRYHASLERIASENLPRLAATAGAPAPVPPALGPGDPTLPGVPLFVAPQRPRAPAEIAALTAAVALARSRGRSTSVVPSADAAWIAERLREDLGDYLRQKPTPYLCNGVGSYLATLRTFSARLGPGQDRRGEWIATHRASTLRSLEAARGALAAASRPPRSSPAFAAPPLASSEDIAREADALLAAAGSAGLVEATPAAVQPAVNRPPLLFPDDRPALTRLQTAKPFVMSVRPLVRDRTARLRLLAAFADLEMLDYLLAAPAVPVDPAAGAIEATLAAVAAAQAANCTCGN